MMEMLLDPRTLVKCLEPAWRRSRMDHPDCVLIMLELESSIASTLPSLATEVASLLIENKNG
jgi:hypothetical protein